jgi:hypothetical protein
LLTVTHDPLERLDALTRMLRALGMPPDQVPSKLEDAAARFRSLTAGRRLLVLLDNAANAGSSGRIAAGPRAAGQPSAPSPQ